MDTAKNSIIDLSAEEARKFFMQQKSFCNISLPNYFNFQELLDAIALKSEKMGFDKICRDKLRPQNYSDVNYHFFQNKDGLLSWRPLQIIHPVIYVYLVKEITEEENWELIVNRFKQFRENEDIKCYSLPDPQAEASDTVLNWWNNIEQKSIELAMDYNYLMITDIANCYGSIYTHSITWAMCGKDNAKEIVQNKKIREDIRDIFRDKIKAKKTILSRTKKQYGVGNAIDEKIQAMCFQQTNGIPQGSVLMDFIAELVLGYADWELSEKLKEKEGEIKNYKILRYRDDYRIFGNSQEEVIKIAKMLTEVLEELNFKLNTQKTLLTQDLICDSIKPDKLYYITHDYKRIEESNSSLSLQKHLLRINHLAHKYPNSGSIQKAMDNFSKRICEENNLDLLNEPGSWNVLISIATNIAYNNPKVYKSFVAIIGKILSCEEDKTKKEKVISKILEKFHRLPNVGYLEIWLQRLTIKEKEKHSYTEDLCKYASGEKVSIWNTEWLIKDLQKLFQEHSIVKKEYINKLPDTIEYKEFESFSRY